MNEGLFHLARIAPRALTARLVGGTDLDVERPCYFRRKMLQIVSHQNIGPSLQSRRENVRILWIGKAGANRKEGLKAFDHRVFKRGFHSRTGALSPFMGVRQRR